MTKIVAVASPRDLRMAMMELPVSSRTPRDVARCEAMTVLWRPAAASGSIAPAISLTEKALKHLNKLRAERNEDLCLRIGVRQGRCSGMSYTMEFENRANASAEDSVIEYDGFAIVCDPKSLLFMFGMELDYSDALIGGGFAFQNPYATKTWGVANPSRLGKKQRALQQPATTEVEK
ncbi:hypothetical protein EJB05_51309, partial [Eragrostis curvula]